MNKHNIHRTLTVGLAAVSIGTGIVPVGASAGSTVMSLEKPSARDRSVPGTPSR